METIIRSYLPKDIPTITWLFNEVVEEGEAFLTEKKYLIKEMEERINSARLCYVSLTNLEISGCYILKPNAKGRGNHIANATYFVDKAYRGKGIGKLLGKHSICTAKEEGFRGMQFNSVVSTNSRSIQLWKSLGFEVIGKVPQAFRIKDGSFVDTFIFYKAL